MATLNSKVKRNLLKYRNSVYPSVETIYDEMRNGIIGTRWWGNGDKDVCIRKLGKWKWVSVWNYKGLLL